MENVDIHDWLLDNPDAFPGIDIRDLTDLDTPKPKHVTDLLGIECIFKGRLLTTKNEGPWIARRMTAFANTVGADDSNAAHRRCN